MSYLTELIGHRITKEQALAKSVGYIRRKLGLSVTDAQVDSVVVAAEAAASQAANSMQVALTAFIRAQAPMLPAEVIATVAATAALNVVDAAIAGAGNVVKANN
jgi:uncharacterized membrane protein